MSVQKSAFSKPVGRPVVYDYGSPSDFLRDLMHYYKSSGSFSVRQRTEKVGACSQALISQVIKGTRKLNRANLPGIAAVFKLTKLEVEYLDRRLGAHLHRLEVVQESAPRGIPRAPRNHLLADWLHPYVKDLVSLKGFRVDPERAFVMLQGLAPAHRIRKSVEFLMREGFWRTTPAGEVVQDDAAVTTSNGIPNEKIRNFHKKALEIASRGLTAFPPDQRKASTVLISVDQEKMDELKGIVDAFQKQLLDFIERHPNGKDALVQITTHLTPIGRSQ